ncbi:DUF2177 family protein [Prosthecomicrobium pneumaticum]|uniref:Putative membrane protein n=1 Tax=Prosthecomicrobium pneumaticum TaxID=81895 RepID=A0A7W9CTF5_9HYPH|nr:DUF2177 family protein [Prosthecomicrobium pneumaticum]MBB5751522.1 putative membrane protein [Prosthecomicrobium pneumaticum]
MSRFVAVAYPATLVAFLAVDAVWLVGMSGVLYRPVLGPILRAEPDLVAAGLFYLIYVAGIVFFAVHPSRRRGLAAAALRGGAFGFCAYATYDLTNQATLAVWSPVLTVADLAWGTFVTGLAATVGLIVAKRVDRR